MLCRTDCWHCALWHSQSSIMLSITVQLFLHPSRKEPFVLAELTRLSPDTGTVILTSKVRLQGHLWSNADVPLFVTVICFIQNPLQFAVTQWFWHKGRKLSALMAVNNSGCSECYLAARDWGTVKHFDLWLFSAFTFIFPLSLDQAKLHFRMYLRMLPRAMSGCLRDKGRDKNLFLCNVTSSVISITIVWLHN